MADGGSGKLKGLRDQMVAATQALAEERRSQSGSSPIPVSSAINTKTTKPVIDGSALRTDERQRLARERREEREKLNAARDSQIIAREKKAKLQYEKQMEDKLRKLEEQKQKDEQKRIAVSEKRKQKILEEKERREANVRQTIEKSSQLEQRQKRWSWSGSETDCNNASKHSTSTTNLKQTEIGISKRFSSSSATLQSSSRQGTQKRSSSLNRLNNKSPLPSQQTGDCASSIDKKDVDIEGNEEAEMDSRPRASGGKDTKRSSSLGRLNVKSPSPHPEAVTKEDIPAHRPQTIPLEGSLISRLLAPTQSSLARSKSSAVLSADGKDSPESHLCPRSASATAISTPPSTSKGPIRSRSIDRMKSPVASGTSSSDSIQASEIEKRDMTARRRSPSPLNISKRPPSPTTENKRTQKVRSPSPSLSKTRLSSPSATQKPVPIQRPPLTANVLNVTKKNAGSELQPKEKAEEGVSSESKSSPVSEKETPSVATKTKEEGNCKTISGSATAEEAAKILAENRRLAREQREREEQERIQRDQEEKLKQEEMARKAEEERAKQKEETQRLEEKRKLEEEEDHRKAQEEKIRIEKEEQERQAELQHQKEEAEAKALEEAEKQRQEREKIMHQNMQERLERKRRIDEIMKRTRKADQLDVKNENMPDQCIEEDNEIHDLESQILEKVNGVNLCEMDDKEESSDPCPNTLLLDASVLKGNEITVNGDRPHIHPEMNGPLESVKQSHVTKDNNLINQDGSQFNEDSDTIQELNGKSSTWTFEEIIDLGIHSMSTGLTSDITVDNCNKDLIEDLNSAPSKKLAFDEDRGNLNLLQRCDTADGKY